MTRQLPKLFLKLNKVIYGKGLRLVGRPFIFRYSKAKLRIGDNVTINSSFLSNMIGLYQRTIIVARDEAIISIGDGCGISGATLYARKEITLGKNVLVGANTKIFDNDFHPVQAEARNANDFSKLELKPVSIGDNVFIGCNCIILKGTRIGDNCIVGAGSVVHGSFPANCVIAGNPARIIKENI
ncbi:MAG: acyltransferase [Lachnospiraceae bacterium]|nr:acyltransferase [Lachnospiraceae bacterium]